jgi:hypothetical protein
VAGNLSTRRKAVSVVTAIVAVGIIGVVLFLARNNLANADVGACLAEHGTSLEQVGCDDPGATYEVVGKVEGKREGESAGACDPFEDQGVDRVYWIGRWARSGVVFCLAGAP